MKFIGLTKILLILIVLPFTAAEARAQKLTAEQILEKHINSVGSAETRRSIKNSIASGLVRYTVLRKGTGGDGRIVFASEGPKMLFGMTFNIPSYPAETMVFDGDRSKVAFAISNMRSEFGDFVYRYNDVLSQGLFGGTLTSGWPLFDLQRVKAKVDLDGSKKINERDTYAISYLPKGGSDLRLTVYIDKESFRHLRTEYRRIISAIQGPNPDASSQQREQIQVLTEDFGDFNERNGLTLPHSYRIHLLLTGSAGTREHEYKAVFTDFMVNQALDPNSFVVEKK